MAPTLTQLFHNRRVRRVLVVAGVALAAWSLAAWVAARALVVVADELPRADRIVVLAGSSTYRERTRLAAALFREGRAPKVTLTNDDLRGGWSNELQRNPYFVERAAAELRRAGVPDEGIETLPRAVTSTHDEALVMREHAEAQGLRSLLVVTSAYHTRRALWTFRKVFEGSGVQVGLVSVPPGDETPEPATWWLHAQGWRVVAGEYVKLIYYRLRY